MKNKRPWLAVLLNIFIPGLGYLYLGRRKVFGYLMTTSSVLGWLWSPSTEVMKEFMNSYWAVGVAVLLTIAFAIDAYIEAKMYNLENREGKNNLKPALNDKGGLITEREEKKAENIQKLKDFIDLSNDKITNDHVQELLGVSDATAERYLDEMEKAGLIKQVGTEGKYTYYSKTEAVKK